MTVGKVRRDSGGFRMLGGMSGDIPWEDYWAVRHPSDPRQGGFYFLLHLYNLPDDQTRIMREQAQQALDGQGEHERQVVVQTFTAIRDLCQRRLDRTAPGNVILCFIQPHPTDPWEAIYDDRGRTINLARQFQEVSGTELGKVWERVVLGFDLMQFRPPADSPT
jgi:hypothetical protein